MQQQADIGNGRRKRRQKTAPDFPVSFRFYAFSLLLYHIWIGLNAKDHAVSPSDNILKFVTRHSHLRPL